MINEDLLNQIEGGDSPSNNPFDLDDLTEAQLREIKARIEGRLPQNDLKSLNLEYELVEQYRLVRALQADVLHDDSVPLNQRSQLAGQVASTLQQLVKMQAEFYTAERFKSLEALMIKYMRRLPIEVADKFINEYEAAGKAA